MNMPLITIGIMSGRSIGFTLNGSYTDGKGMELISGFYESEFAEGKIIIKHGTDKFEAVNGFTLYPVDSSTGSFTLPGVTIGLKFHWQRQEDQTFRGSLKLIVEDDRLTAVNEIPVEEYLRSVISSEMNAASSHEFLKAHAVISRSWLLAQIDKSRLLKVTGERYSCSFASEAEIIRWYDREDHRNYDVCADDHCQRYQGITRASNPAAGKAISDTRGEVLTFNGKVCDTRFYKCCGGITELFENVWEPVNHPYLSGIIDSREEPAGFITDLKENGQAIAWISGLPDAFCNTSDNEVLRQVLNDYDLETKDFFRWKNIHTQAELSAIIEKKTGIGFGMITELIPLERGVSGRIIRLLIRGTKREMVIGKELEIRKALSESHLYSSCFYVVKKEDEGNIAFEIHGAGWGHGVGLCQIGAAVMASKGYDYKEILMHYFRNATLRQIY